MIKLLSTILILTFINQSIQFENLKPIDLTWPFENSTIYWPGSEAFNFTKQITATEPFWYAMNDFCAGEHGGTHLDAPYHFYEQGMKVGQIPLDKLIVPGVLVDISKEVEKTGPSRNLLKSDLIDWEQKNGPFPQNCAVIIKFGWSKYYHSKKDYLGMTDDGKLNFPSISPDAAQWLASSGKVVGVGLDVASVDPGSSVNFEAHRKLAVAGIYNMENVKLTEELPVTHFTLTVMPMNIAEGTGAPLRLIAFVNKKEIEQCVTKNL